MGILRLPGHAGGRDKDESEAGRGPVVSRRGALRLSAGGVATFALSSIANAGLLNLLVPEAAMAADSLGWVEVYSTGQNPYLTNAHYINTCARGISTPTQPADADTYCVELNIDGQAAWRNMYPLIGSQVRITQNDNGNKWISAYHTWSQAEVTECALIREYFMLRHTVAEGNRTLARANIQLALWDYTHYGFTLNGMSQSSYSALNGINISDLINYVNSNKSKYVGGGYLFAAQQPTRNDFNEQSTACFWLVSPKPLTLRAFYSSTSSESKPAPGLYKIYSKDRRTSGVHLKLVGGGSSSGVYTDSDANDSTGFRNVWVVTPYYKGGDVSGSRYDAWRICSLQENAHYLDYWGHADCSHIASCNYANDTWNQALDVAPSEQDGSWHIYKKNEKQYLSAANKDQDSCGWCKHGSGSGGRIMEWALEPFGFQVSDWAPDNLYAKYRVYDASGNRVGSLVTDKSGYANQITDDSYEHRLPPGRYYYTLAWAGWKGGSSAISSNLAEMNKVVDGYDHHHCFTIEESDSPQNWLRTAVPVGTGRIKLYKYLRKKTNGIKIPDGYYRVRPAGNTNYCLDSLSNSSAQGLEVTLWKTGEGENPAMCQVWVVHNEGDGLITLAPVKNMTLRLNRYGGKDDWGVRAVTYYHNCTSAEKWSVADGSADGTFTLLSATSSSVALDVKDASYKNGAEVRMWDRNGSTAQSWVFEALDAGGAYGALDASMMPDEPEASMDGWEYGLFTDADCTERVATFRCGDGVPRDDDGNEYRPYIGRALYIRETVAGEGCQLDKRTYRACVTSVGQGTLYIDMVDLPLPAITVHFLLVDKDNKATEVSSYKVGYGKAVSTSDEGFAEADGKLAEFYGVETTEYVRRWYEGSKYDGTDSGYKGINFNDGSAVYTGAGKAVRDVWLYGSCLTGTVTFYVDGTDESHVVMVGESVVKGASGTAAGARASEAQVAAAGLAAYTRVAAETKVKARFKNIYLGSRFEIPPAVAAAAAKEGCTPGWDGWFTDKSDKAFTEDEPGQGGASRLGQTSVVLTAPQTNLFSVNRATLGFGYVTGSERPDLVEGGCLAKPEEGAAAADTSLPENEVKRVDVTRRLPTRSAAYAQEVDGRWRTYSPRFWFSAQDGSGQTSETVKLAKDSTRWIDWSRLTRDGVVDERA